MKKRFSQFLFLLFAAWAAKAQKPEKDTIFVALKDSRAMAVHEVKKEENLYSIAQLYSVPAIVLSQNNDISFYDVLEPGRKLFVPMGAYNYLSSQPEGNTPARRLYYRTQSKDTYESLSSALGIDENILRSWNRGNELHVSASGVLFMGWILKQAKDAPQSNTTLSSEPVGAVAPAGLAPGAVPSKDTAKKGPPTELELVYNYQTSNGLYLDSLSGMVVFFKPQTTVNKDLIYAFSNDVPKGKVVKVVNPSNGKYVFAKVIGALPATKQYLNARIGVDGRARELLETREIKLWCNFFFKY